MNTKRKNWTPEREKEVRYNIKYPNTVLRLHKLMQVRPPVLLARPRLSLNLSRPLCLSMNHKIGNISKLRDSAHLLVCRRVPKSEHLATLWCLREPERRTGKRHETLPIPLLTNSAWSFASSFITASSSSALIFDESISSISYK